MVAFDESPALMMDGASDKVMSDGLTIASSTRKSAGEDVPSLNVELITMTGKIPGIIVIAAVTRVISRVGEKSTIAKELPLKTTFDPATKPLPSIVNSKSGPPAETDDGFRTAIVGSGFAEIEGLVFAFTARLSGPDIPPPGGGLVMAMASEPAVAIFEAGT